jgi:hypothetical protein
LKLYTYTIVDANDNEIFLCRLKKKSIEEKEAYWFRLEDIPKDVLNDYKSSHKLDENVMSETTCSTDKTKVYSCELKARTCGILILCGNCGLIEGFSELYGSESCTQVGSFLVAFHENFTGNKLTNF